MNATISFVDGALLLARLRPQLTPIRTGRSFNSDEQRRCVVDNRSNLMFRPRFQGQERLRIPG